MNLERWIQLYGNSLFTPLNTILESASTKVEDGFKTIKCLIIHSLIRICEYYVEYCRAVNLLILFLISALAVSAFYIIMPRGMFYIFFVQYLVVASISLFLLMYPRTSETISTYCITLSRKLENLCEYEHLERWEEKRYYPFVKSKRNVPT